MEKHGKLSQNDVDEADTAASLDKHRSAIWIFGKSPNFGDFPKIQIAERCLSNDAALFS